ncbi:MAG: hypothetical protein Ct9H300mP12_05590 [Acidimicrobiales bacterium]|nr:MAG: hypothetical protein Ct9H300mP12_05590 [Acidimicrobiales bacterium]
MVLLATAQWLRNLGYRAVPASTTRLWPYRWQSRLGWEYGRHGLVITPSSVPGPLREDLTDAPLHHDSPSRVWGD